MSQYYRINPNNGGGGNFGEETPKDKITLSFSCTGTGHAQGGGGWFTGKMTGEFNTGPYNYIENVSNLSGVAIGPVTPYTNISFSMQTGNSAYNTAITKSGSVTLTKKD